MKVAQRVTAVEFKVIVGKAWKEKDGAFLVDYATNQITVHSKGTDTVYQFEESNIMKMAETLLDGVGKYALDFKLVQLSVSKQLFGRTKGVDMVLKKHGLQNRTKPIMETPYRVFLQ